MGMIGTFLRVSKDQLDKFLSDSDTLLEYVDSDEAQEDDKYLDIDKSWDVINYIITGHTLETLEEATPPLSKIVFSGQLIDEEQDLGYGPAHYLLPQQVRELSIELSKISEQDFRQKYNADVLQEKSIYPEGWSNEEEDIQYVSGYFAELKAFYQEAAKADQAVISFVS